MRPSSLGGGRILRRTLSVCLSVCPSVPCLFTLEHRSRVFVNLADVRYLLFCLHVRAAYSTAISAAQACYFIALHRIVMIVIFVFISSYKANAGCFMCAQKQQLRLHRSSTSVAHVQMESKAIHFARVLWSRRALMLSFTSA